MRVQICSGMIRVMYQGKHRKHRCKNHRHYVGLDPVSGRLQVLPCDSCGKPYKGRWVGLGP